MLGENDDGVPSDGLVSVVRAALSDERVRPLTDVVTVQAVQILPYTIDATLTVESGPSEDVVEDTATAAATDLVEKVNVCGGVVRRSALIAALYVPGVTDITLTHPAADVVGQVTPGAGIVQAPWCTSGASAPYGPPTTHPLDGISIRVA